MRAAELAREITEITGSRSVLQSCSQTSTTSEARAWDSLVGRSTHTVTRTHVHEHSVPVPVFKPAAAERDTKRMKDMSRSFGTKGLQKTVFAVRLSLPVPVSTQPLCYYRCCRCLRCCFITGLPGYAKLTHSDCLSITSDVLSLTLVRWNGERTRDTWSHARIMPCCCCLRRCCC